MNKQQKDFQDWEKSIDGITYEFGGSNIVTDKENVLIAKSMTYLPLRIIKKIIKEVLFASEENCFAWHIPLEQIDNKKSIIFLSHYIKDMKEKEALHTILHEIGHFILKHKSPILLNLSQIKTKNQEKEANDFANRLLK